jgi:sugar lactone lactonase YvrE
MAGRNTKKEKAAHSRRRRRQPNLVVWGRAARAPPPCRATLAASTHRRFSSPTVFVASPPFFGEPRRISAAVACGEPRRISADRLSGASPHFGGSTDGTQVASRMWRPDHVVVSATVGGARWPGFRDGAAAAALFGRSPRAFLHLPDGRVLVADAGTNLIRALSADLQQVSTVAGDGGQGYWGRHRDGAALQAQFRAPYGLALRPGGRGVLVVDYGNHRLRMLSADLQQVSTAAGTGEMGYRDGAAAQAQFHCPAALTLLPDGCVLVADEDNHRIRVLSADLQQVSTVAGDGEARHRDGAAAQAQFRYPAGLALLLDGRVLVADNGNNRIRVLSADLHQVSTEAGEGEGGHQDGAAAEALFRSAARLARMPGGCVLVADRDNHCIRMLSADLQQVSTLAGDGGEGRRGGAAAQARFRCPSALALLPDGRVLVADSGNHRICVLSADLQQVSTVAGGGGRGLLCYAGDHRDGAAAQAHLHNVAGFSMLPDGRVLVTDLDDNSGDACLRVLSADLQQVSTLTNADELDDPAGLCLLPDGRLLASGCNSNWIRVLEGFPAAPLGNKPSHKQPKKTKTKQLLLQEKKKRALAGGASSSSSGAASACGPVPKRSRSGASSSTAAVPSSDSEGEEEEEEEEGEPLV